MVSSSKMGWGAAGGESFDKFKSALEMKLPWRTVTMIRLLAYKRILQRLFGLEW